MEVIIEFLKNGIAIMFYGILFIFGVFTIYSIFKGIVKKMFTEDD
jgi:hypothetical protein|nr:MAG TPA: hypothetical protein [Caudoviricetes sp.]